MTNRYQYKDIDVRDIDWEQAFDSLLYNANRRHGGAIKILKKDHNIWWHLFHSVLSILHLLVTFGCAGWHYNRYNMTFGRFMFVTPNFEEKNAVNRCATLSHEIAHFDEMYFGDPEGRWSAQPGRRGSRNRMAWFGLKYLCGIPLPLFDARFRLSVETAGFLQTIRVFTFHNGGECPEYVKEHVARALSSAGYGWMCSKKEAAAITQSLVEGAESAWGHERLHTHIFGNYIHLKGLTQR